MRIERDKKKEELKYEMLKWSEVGITMWRPSKNTYLFILGWLALTIIPKNMPPKNRKRKRPEEEENSTDGNEGIMNETILSKRVPLPDADVFYVEDFADTRLASKWFEELDSLSTWYKPTLKVYGHKVIQSREIAAYVTDPNLVIKYSGTVVDLHHEYPPVLTTIQNFIESELGCKFNHVMLNKYQDGSVYIGQHSDSLDNKIIATFSLGASRTFVMSHRSLSTKSKSKPKNVDQFDHDTSKKDLSNLRHSWVLPHSSLVVMQGKTQHNWKHEIPKEPKVKDSRISLTFRQIG